MAFTTYPHATNSLRFAFLTTTCIAALLAQPVMAQTDQSADADAEDEMVMEEVNVTGIRRSLDFSADIKREADQVVDAITAQDIGLFSDNNIGEALARIPGVLLEREAGEGYRISIRGLGPRFVRTTVNGRTALSPSGGETGGGDDARGFTYNIMPSEVISKAEVSKSTQAHEIEGGIGGSVNLVTNRPLDFTKGDKSWYLSGTARATYNDLLEDTRPRATLFYNQTFGENFGLYVGAVWDEADRIDNLAESQRLRTYGARLEEGTLLNGTPIEDRTTYDVAHFSGVRFQEQPIERDRQTYVTGLQ
jgi:TonB-dependent receptor